ncbi:ribonuclease Y [Candidatus Fermentibacteria bacterium]|nr:ribonuclease Y [Candidatus Fermentibacteria bacterium]
MGEYIMTAYTLAAAVAAVTTILGFFLGARWRAAADTRRMAGVKEISSRILQDAKRDAEAIKKEASLQAKDEWYQAKLQFDAETRERRREFEGTTKKLSQREFNLERKADIISKKEREFANKVNALLARERIVKQKEERLTEILTEQNRHLERIAGMTEAEAKRQLLENLENEARAEAALLVKSIKDRAIEGANREAKKIISLAIQRCAAEHVTESTVSVVSLPSDEMKGRIIGREGRNIRAFETATGVDVVVDDTPEAVALSCFDPIRREVARISLERLLEDGRIHPTKIEEVVQKVSVEMADLIKRTGEEAALEVGVHGLHPELIKLLGRLRFRSSYGQNVLVHSKETAIIAGIMAAELGLDGDLARRGGLLHDIGKAVDHMVDGTHSQIGIELVTRYGEGDIVANCVAAHHEETEFESPLAVLVQAADAVSGARPGARRELLETYVKRLHQLEEIGDSFEGVEKAYAIQAGREIRIIVAHQLVDDAKAQSLASSIARKVESQMDYPGQIKITVIRETRAVDYAR